MLAEGCLQPDHALLHSCVSHRMLFYGAQQSICWQLVEGQSVTHIVMLSYPANAGARLSHVAAQKPQASYKHP